MKRLIFVSNLFPDAAAPHRGLDNATVLHALADRYAIRVLSPRPTLALRPRAPEPRAMDRVFSPRYVITRYLPKVGSPFNHQLLARALRPALREAAPCDAVLCSWLFPDGCAVSRLAGEMGFPFVSIAQGSDVHQYLRQPVRRQLIVESSRRASAFITRSAELARLLGEAGVETARLHPIYNGIDHTLFRPGDRAEARHALGWPAEAPVVLFVGNFVAIKNPLLLVAAVLGAPELAEARLVMVGSGPLEKGLAAAAERLGARGRLVLAGRRGPAEIARMMQAADALALPSQNEGVPNVILEAFGCGLPVAASAVGGIPEVHAGEAFGRLVPPGNREALTAALRDVLRQPPASAPIAAFARRFTWERTAAQYAELLEAAIASHL